MSQNSPDDPIVSDDYAPFRERTPAGEVRLHDDLLAVLGDRKRRIALRTLSDFSEEITVSELARVMRVDAELRGTGDSLPAEETLAISLHHHHLPKLADAGLVSYDPETRCAVRTDAADEGDTAPGVDDLLDSFARRNSDAPG